CSSVSICRGMAGLQFVGVGTFILRACPYPANTPAMKRQQTLTTVIKAIASSPKLSTRDSLNAQRI
ncbi:hypothetical protein, partial [Halomonas garicola]|uniref:hypothetical protein n=1 Tax=Halomonas garicola TaxID=1690008 RepID=UPI0028967755